MEGDWSCYRGGQFNGSRMVMLQRWCLMEGTWSCYRGGLYNGGRMVMLRRWPVYMRENGHVTKMVNLVEGAWSWY